MESEVSAAIAVTLGQYPGFIVGEYHTTRYSKKILIDNIELLSKLGVKYIFDEAIEGEWKVADFYFSPEDMEKELEDRIVLLDALNISNKTLEYERAQKYNSMQLYKKAKRHDIQVIAIDRLDLKRKVLKSQGKRRIPEMNQFAEEKIRATINPGEKYVVLCGIFHAAKRKTTEPGLSNRLDIPVFFPEEYVASKSELIKGCLYSAGRKKIPVDYYVKYGPSESLEW